MLMMLLAVADDTGQAEKFTAIYERYHRALCGLAYSILKEQHAAEDAVQNAFLNILKNLDKIVEIDCSKTRAFLIVITRRECYKIYNARKSDNLIEWEYDPADTRDILWEDIERSVDREALRTALLGLAETDRQLLLGKYACGYSYKELSDLLGLSEKNVSVRIVRAKQRVIALLKEGGEGR